jgi:LysM repeat protein
MSSLPLQRYAGFSRHCTVLALTALLAVGSAQAADHGLRPHAKGAYDTVTATYTVADGDDLFAISERFEVPADQLKALNKLTTNEVKPGQKIHVAASDSQGAAHPSHAHQATAKKPLAKMTCEDFVGLDESFKPKAVYWAVAYGKDGKPEAEDVDVVGVESVVPVVIEECQKTPKETFWQKVKAEWKKIQAKL